MHQQRSRQTQDTWGSYLDDFIYFNTLPHSVHQVQVSLQPKAASYLPAPLPTDHCRDRIWQPALWDRRGECPVHLTTHCPYTPDTHTVNSASVLSIFFFILSRTLVNMKYRYEKPHKRHFWPKTDRLVLTPHPLLPPSPPRRRRCKYK